MALMPGAVQKPVAAHGGPMGTILGVVIHVTAGEGDPFNEFANPSNQVSSHFGIGNGQGGMADGLVEQYVDTANDSWAQEAGNGSYISVETEGEPTDPLTAAQIASFALVLQWCNQVHGVPLVIVDTPGESGFITHGDGGADWGGHLDCPGPLRTPQRQDILNAIAPPLPEGTDMASLQVVLINGQPQAFYVDTGGDIIQLEIANGAWVAFNVSGAAKAPKAAV